eukprot:TRINITY_DN2393_c0_g1_i1.p1 TRINITY_DN2393_c0_g1~~TRINITY_DN2393_c0_g1_i1.p1  ORF type:complete len:263 (+),score=47.71 TRINITY_DN2393_c0_g1_i1:734-1522(+)
MRPKMKPKKLYVVLYRDFIYLFNPQTRVSYNERPHSFINVKFIIACDIEAENIFSVTTPLRKFVLKTKHDVAMAEWVTQIRTQAERKNKALPPMRGLDKRKTNNRGYSYTKNINKLMSIVEPIGGDKTRVHKLKSSGISTIGRSSSNDIRLTYDKYVSRSHCKIVVEDNVPYVCDLGQGKSGTRVNKKKITKAPLKPNDVITIGRSDFLFLVKGGDEIFKQTQPPVVDTPKKGEEFSDSDEDEKSKSDSASEKSKSVEELDD